MQKKQTTRKPKKKTPTPSTGLLFDPFFMLHDVSGPDLPQRLTAIHEGLAAAGLLQTLTPIPPRDAVEGEVCLIHSPAYFRQVRSDILFGSGELSTGDTEISEHSLEVALKATGGILNAVDAVIRGEMRNAFCATRPPGHHATPVRGMGFCLFNHAAIAARYARKHHGIDRILILDWDVHHGNGTQAAFYDDPSILFFSSHQWPLYPGTGRRNETGAGKALGQTLNAPLPAGSGYHEILGEIETRLEPRLQQFKPELIILSAGFDSRINDPLGDFTLEDEQFALLTRRVMDWAKDYSNNRIISILEGGYNLRTLGGAVAAHVKTLANHHLQNRTDSATEA